MTPSNDGAISVRRFIDDPASRPILIERLRSGRLMREFSTARGDMDLKGSHGGFVSQLDTGEIVFVKRSDQTVQGAELGPEGMQWVRNEAAAYAIAELLGFEDIVLPTILRHTATDGVDVAVRLYVEPSDSGELTEGRPPHHLPIDQLARAATFDFVIEQTDRMTLDGQHGGNWYVWNEPELESRLLLFDHQLCFGSRPEFGLRSAFWAIAGHKVGPYLGRLGALQTAEARAMLSQYLTDDQLTGVAERVDALTR
jgi:hypothetical protein